MRLRRNISSTPHTPITRTRRRLSSAAAAVARRLAHCPPNTKAPTALSIAVGAYRRACRRAGLIYSLSLPLSACKRRLKYTATIQLLIQPLMNPNHDGDAPCITATAKMTALCARPTLARANERLINARLFSRRPYGALIRFVVVFTG